METTKLLEKLGDATISEFQNLCNYSVNSTIIVEYSALFNKDELDIVEEFLEDLTYVKIKNELYGKERIKLLHISIHDMYRFIKDLELEMI